MKLTGSETRNSRYIVCQGGGGGGGDVQLVSQKGGAAESDIGSVLAIYITSMHGTQMDFGEKS